MLCEAKKTCFAYRAHGDGTPTCAALTKMYCGERNCPLYCPFYKSKAQFEKEAEKYGKH